MEQDVRRNYEYRRLPDNIRQIGEISSGSRIYIEDYVLTYIRKVFQDKQERSIVVLIGCEGKEAAADSLFLYGAVEIPVNSESADMQEEQWDMLFHLISEYFPYGRIMGWGCGVGIWNSEVDYWVRKMQEEQFTDDGRVLFLADLSEREEKVFVYNDHAFEELSGYFVYYERNPQMQEYMLREQPEGEGFESDYEDEVTQSIRTVIQDKQNRQKQMHYITYGMACLLLLMILVGGSLLVRSLAKINSLEETIETLSDYVAEAKRDETSKMTVSQEKGAANAASPASAALSSVQPSASGSVADASFAPGSAASAASPGKRAVIPSGSSAPVPAASAASPAQGTAATDGASTSVSAVSAESPEPVSAVTATPLPLTRSTSLPLQTSQSKKTSSLKSNKSVTAKESGAAEKTGKKASQPMIAGGVDRIKKSYIVRKGDTLSQIVWNQYHSFAYMDRVQRVNQIEDSDRIYVGQCILLPDV